jgi:hypothetical protein
MFAVWRGATGSTPRSATIRSVEAPNRWVEPPDGTRVAPGTRPPSDRAEPARARRLLGLPSGACPGVRLLDIEVGAQREADAVWLADDALGIDLVAVGDRFGERTVTRILSGPPGRPSRVWLQTPAGPCYASGPGVARAERSTGVAPLEPAATTPAVASRATPLSERIHSHSAQLKAVAALVTRSASSPAPPPRARVSDVSRMKRVAALVTERPDGG